MAVFGFGRRNAVGRQYNGGNVSVMLPRYTTPPERNTRDWLEMFGRNPRLAVVDAAQENILYLVMNTTTKHYDIYAKIKGDGDTYTMEQLDDTTVDLSGYVEKEDGKGLSDENFTAALKDKLDGIAAGANKYVHPTHTAAASGLYKTTVDEEGHVTATTPVTKDDITKLGIPAQDTTYDEATTAKAGLMSAADKTKLDGMGATINKAIADHTATDAEVSEMLAEVYGE